MYNNRQNFSARNGGAPGNRFSSSNNYVSHQNSGNGSFQNVPLPNSYQPRKPNTTFSPGMLHQHVSTPGNYQSANFLNRFSPPTSFQQFAPQPNFSTPIPTPNPVYQSFQSSPAASVTNPYNVLQNQTMQNFQPQFQSNQQHFMGNAQPNSASTQPNHTPSAYARQNPRMPPFQQIATPIVPNKNPYASIALNPHGNGGGDLTQNQLMKISQMKDQTKSIENETYLIAKARKTDIPDFPADAHQFGAYLEWRFKFL